MQHGFIQPLYCQAQVNYLVVLKLHIYALKLAHGRAGMCKMSMYEVDFGAGPGKVHAAGLGSEPMDMPFYYIIFIPPSTSAVGNAAWALGE